MSTKRAVRGLTKGEVPILEEGLPALVLEGVQSGRLRFVVGSQEAAAGAEFVFICVQTPQSDTGAADLSVVESVAREIAPVLRPGTVVVNKSTMPVGSTDAVARALKSAGAVAHVGVASNPEFLREGQAVRDSLAPHRVVIGCDDTEVAVRVSALYRAIQAPVLVTDPASAEMIKYASNAFLATKISFVNAIANLCEAVNADVREVVLGMGYDPRIGFEVLHPGPGFGGSCFPKDTAALLHTADQAGYDFGLLRAVMDVNVKQRDRVVDKLRAAAGGDLRDAKVGIWGLAFKANTDDLRESPAVFVAERLIAEGASIRAYDPAAREAAAVRLPGLDIATDVVRRRGGRVGARAAHGVGRVPLARLRPGVRVDAAAVRRDRRSQPARPVSDAPIRFRVPGRRSLMPRAVVTGGAGFLGSHLCRALHARGWQVVAVDNLSTGFVANIDDLLGSPDFEFIEHDVINGLPIEGPVSAVLHFASAASPPAYLDRPIATLEVGSIGTQHALELARKHDGARVLLASTSEIYGDPEQSPQRESYWGNVNPVGPRSVYDEAKRFGEAITTAYHRVYGIDTKIARIFNTYGPFLRPEDGRVISNFLAQAIDGRPLTVYGDGSHTRSFCFVDDLVGGLLALLDSPHVGPMNLGNPNELTVLELADAVLDVTGSSSEIVFEPLPDDDPRQRRPDIGLAEQVLGWRPVIDLREGLVRTYDWYRGSGDRA